MEIQALLKAHVMDPNPGLKNLDAWILGRLNFSVRFRSQKSITYNTVEIFDISYPMAVRFCCEDAYPIEIKQTTFIQFKKSALHIKITLS